MSSPGPFRVLSMLGTACRGVGWLLAVVAVLATVMVLVTTGDWQEALTGASVFLASLVGGLFFWLRVSWFEPFSRLRRIRVRNSVADRRLAAGPVENAGRPWFLSRGFSLHSV